MLFTVVRNGIVRVSESWEDLLTHDDVVEPGRLSELHVAGPSSKASVHLSDREVLIFFKRTFVSTNPGDQAPSSIYILGKRLPNGIEVETSSIRA